MKDQEDEHQKSPEEQEEITDAKTEGPEEEITTTQSEGPETPVHPEETRTSLVQVEDKMTQRSPAERFTIQLTEDKATFETPETQKVEVGREGAG